VADSNHAGRHATGIVILVVARGRWSAGLRKAKSVFNSAGRGGEGQVVPGRQRNGQKRLQHERVGEQDARQPLRTM
jgi:hypothetical protein